MRVFLSWSGNQSHQIALILKEWLPSVLQALDTWISSADIEKGEAWFSAISESLVKSDGVGVFCLTNENLKAPWLAYEAGALASSDRGRVATFLHRVNSSEVTAPLGLFQATNSSSKSDVLLLVTTLNNRLPSPLSDQRLQRAFDSNWDALEQQLSKVEAVPSSPASKPDANVLLAEILNVVRRIEKDSSLRIDERSANSVFGLGGLVGVPTVSAGLNRGTSVGLDLLGTDPLTIQAVEKNVKNLGVFSQKRKASEMLEIWDSAKATGIKIPGDHSK